MATRYARTISAASIDLGRVPFDLYATDSDNRLVLFCRAGFELTPKHKKLLMGSNRLLYISDGDMDHYLDYAFERIDRIVASKSIDTEEKSKIVHGIGKRIVQQLISDPRSGSAITHSKRFVESYTDLIFQSREAANNLFAISSTDSYTFSHSINVCTFCLLLGGKLHRNNRVVLQTLGVGGLLHDIGMTQIDQNIIYKKGRLTSTEWEQVRRHPVLGAEMVREHGLPEDVQIIVRNHHERYDGSGYPDGLRGEQIHPLARIAAVAEVYDAITSDRVYGKQQNQVRALMEMTSTSNWFAPEVFEALLRVVLRNEQLIERFRSRNLVTTRPINNIKPGPGTAEQA